MQLSRRSLLAALGGGVAVAGCSESTSTPGSSPATTAPEPPDEVTGAYGQFQFDAATTGSSTAVTGPSDALEEWWHFSRFETGSGYGTSSPVVAEGTVYVAIDETGEAPPVLFALDATTGDVEWESPDALSARGTPAVAGDVLVGAQGSAVAGIERETGETRWTVGEDMTPEVTVAGNHVYAVKTSIPNDALYKVDAATGDVVWERTLERAPQKAAVADGTVFLGEQLRALDAASGRTRWQDTDGPTVVRTPTVADGRLYVATQTHEIQARNPDDGSVVWSATPRSDAAGGGHGPIHNSVAVADGTVVVVTGWALTALDAATGERRWARRIRGDNPPLVVDGRVYVTGIQTLEVFDLADGTRTATARWDRNQGSPTTPAVVDDVVFAPGDGIYALL